MYIGRRLDGGANGELIERCARRAGRYRFVVEWKLALTVGGMSVGIIEFVSVLWVYSICFL